MTHPVSQPSVRVSLTDVARRAGVSPATVSRAFNRPELLNTATLERIIATAQTLGFRPNRLGSSLRSGSTKTLGLLLPTMANPVFAACFEGAERCARRAGYSVMLTTTGYEYAREIEGVRELIDHRVEGLILTVGNPGASETLAELAGAELPFVLAYNESADYPFVSIDNATAAGDMVEHLATLGHRHLAFLSGPLEDSDRAAARLEGVYRRARKLSLPTPRHVAVDHHTAADARRLTELMGAHQAPDAIFCSNDLLAASVISTLATLGCSVPGDVSVAGFDGTDFASLTVPSIASVYQPSREIGHYACESLLAALGGGVPASHSLSHRLAGGQSLACLLPPSSQEV